MLRLPKNPPRRRRKQEPPLVPEPPQKVSLEGADVKGYLSTGSTLLDLAMQNECCFRAIDPVASEGKAVPWSKSKGEMVLEKPNAHAFPDMGVVESKRFSQGLKPMAQRLQDRLFRGKNGSGTDPCQVRLDDR